MGSRSSKQKKIAQNQTPHSPTPMDDEDALGLLDVVTSDLLPQLLSYVISGLSLSRLEQTSNIFRTALSHPTNKLWGRAMAKRFWLDSTELLASHPNYTSVEWKSEYQKVLGLHGPIKKYFDKSFPIAQLGSDIAIIKAVPYGIPSLIGFCISNKMYFRTTLSGRNFYATLLTDTGVHSANLISVLTRVGRLALEGILTDPWHTLDVVLYRGACVYGRSPHSKRLILELGYSDLVVDIFTSERKSAHYVCSRAKSAIYQMGWDHREQFALKYTENLIKALKQKENTRYTYKCINLLNDWARDEEARGILCNKGLIPVLSECLCVSDESIHEITVSALLNLSNSSRKLIEFEFNGNKIYQQLLPIFRSSSSVRDRVTILMLYSRLNSFCIMPENIETLIQSFIYDKKNDEAALALVDDQVFDPDDFSFWTVENLEVCQILGFWVLAFCPLLKTEKWSSVGDKFEAFFKKFKGHSDPRVKFLHKKAREGWDITKTLKSSDTSESSQET